MNLEDAIRTRRSIRSFRPDPIQVDKLDRLLELATQAPSSFNAQPWRFHVVLGDARPPVLNVLAQTTRYVGEYLATLSDDEAEMAEEFFADAGHAPVLIGISVPDTDVEMDRINNLLAVGGAIQNLQLAANAEGLGSCSITFSYWVRGELADAMGVRDGRMICSVVLLGVPAEDPAAPPRRDDLVDFVG